jgi:DNA-directed RNA polymerase subunit RPC12/RpoP
MKYVCNRCSKVFQADDITIHYITGNNGLEIVAICPSCLEKYLGKTKEATDQKEDDIERRKMPMKW